MATTGVLDEAVGRARVPDIVIDCSAVTFADLAFLRALSGSGSEGTRIEVVAPSLAVRRLLDVTETTSRFLAAGHPRSVSWSAPVRTPRAPAN
ncbi:hypothetical protein OG599_31390 [Streptomyces sp. NBC_01335]|uniref:hypothetical protein n=1 Tax=Streptomyces sp. NBC_01335 TaxID=2903828 RepID=UPI002E0E4AF8|nr:hypothetical protein OG599_31390 [Streptomyces sp. NBC_01335]